MSEAGDADVKVKVEESEGGECDGRKLPCLMTPDGNHLDCSGKGDKTLTENGQLDECALSKRNETARQRRARLQKANKRRQSQRKNETARQRRARLQKANKRRQSQKKNETPEQRRARLDKDLERRKRAKINETPEQRRQRLDKQAEQQRIRREKQRQLLKADNPEDWRRKTKKNQEEELLYSWQCKSDEELTKDCKRMLVERRDKWKSKVTWDEGPDGKLMMTREEMLRVMLVYHRFITKKKKQEQMSEEKLAEIRAMKKFKSLEKSIEMSEEERKRKRMEAYLRQHAYKANMPEEKREKQRQKHMETCKRYFRNMTEEQRERVQNSQRKAVKKYNAKNKDKLREYYKEKNLNQTPEQRQKTLQYQRINQAKRLLKRKLEATGTPQDKIQKQVDQLVSKMKSEPLPPLEQVSVYKPRPRKKPRPEMQTPLVEMNPQHCHNVSMINSETIQASFGTPLLQNIKSNIANVHLDLPSSSLSLSPSQSVFQEKISHPEEREMEGEDYYDPDPDDIVTPTHSPPPSSPTETTSSIAETYLAVDNVQAIQATSAERPLPPVISQSPASHIVNQCPHCSSSFPELSQMQSHVRSSHQNKCWKCPKCPEVLLSSGDLLEHFKSNHVKPEQDAHHNIGTSTKTKNSFKRNFDQPGKRKNAVYSKSVKTLYFICMKCPSLSSKSQFGTVDKLLDHVRISHPKAFWPCPRCKLLKYNRASLKIHSMICTMYEKTM